MTRPIYRVLPGGNVEIVLHCVARGHLARFGEPALLGVTRGALPLVGELARQRDRLVCPACRAVWLALPAWLRPPSPADV